MKFAVDDQKRARLRGELHLVETDRLGERRKPCGFDDQCALIRDCENAIRFQKKVPLTAIEIQPPDRPPVIDKEPDRRESGMKHPRVHREHESSFSLRQPAVDVLEVVEVETTTVPEKKL